MEGQPVPKRTKTGDLILVALELGGIVGDDGWYPNAIVRAVDCSEGELVLAIEDAGLAIVVQREREVEQLWLSTEEAEVLRGLLNDYEGIKKTSPPAGR